MTRTRSEINDLQISLATGLISKIYDQGLPFEFRKNPALLARIDLSDLYPSVFHVKVTHDQKALFGKSIPINNEAFEAFSVEYFEEIEQKKLFALACILPFFRYRYTLSDTKIPHRNYRGRDLVLTEIYNTLLKGIVEKGNGKLELRSKTRLDSIFWEALKIFNSPGDYLDLTEKQYQDWLLFASHDHDMFHALIVLSGQDFPKFKPWLKKRPNASYIGDIREYYRETRFKSDWRELLEYRMQ